MSLRNPSPNDLIIGSNIRRRRLAAGISQEQLSKVVGVSFQQLQKYEKGINRISAVALYQIAMALETTMVELLAGIAVGHQGRGVAPLQPKPRRRPIYGVRG